MTAPSGLRKRVTWLMKLVLLAISATLAVFLGGLGDKVLSDLEGWYQAPAYEQFEDAEALRPLLADEDRLREERQRHEKLVDAAQEAVGVLQRRLDSEQESYENWLKARRIIGSPEEDPEVRAKLQILERLRAEREEVRLKASALAAAREDFQRRDADINAKIAVLRAAQQERYQAAERSYELKVFLIRLMVVGPILAFGLWLFFKKRRSAYWPLVWGFILFALYQFFLGLVPYLPSYGGYVRYAVGILLTLAVGWYLVRSLTRLAERWKAELAQSSAERARKIGKENAFKAFQRHRCPACEKDFLLAKWRPAAKAISEAVAQSEAPDFCPHCGMRLFEKCARCGERGFAHFSFCSGCGHPTSTSG